MASHVALLRGINVGGRNKVHTPDGYGTSELAQALFRFISAPANQKTRELAATARNWATATKLLSLCQE